MADALLAGLPRIVRVVDEIRARGWLMVAVGAGVAGWWTVQWLLDQPVDTARTWLYAAVSAVPIALGGVLTGRPRVGEGLRSARFPTARVVYETRADSRDRRIRLSGAVFLFAIVVLMFDRLAEWSGVTAGVIVGVAVGLGVTDLVDARRWRQAERSRESDLFIKIGPRALASGLGPGEIFEVSVPTQPVRRVDL